MPIAGTDLGKVWQGQEGMGIAEKVDTSQSDGMKQYAFKLKLADQKQHQADQKATEANIYKRTQKPEWWSIHDSELSQTHSDLMNETARLMRVKGVQDPFALSSDPEVIEIQKKWNALDTMAKTSKDLREYSQKMQDAEFRKTVDEDSFNQFNDWFGKNKISDIVNKGMQPPSIRKKNPIEDFGTYWMPFIKQNGGFEDKDGNELTREGLANIVAMKYAAPNQDLAAFDQKMLAGLDPTILTALEEEQKAQALQGNQKTLGQIYAENQLWRLAQSQVTPYNEDKALGIASSRLGDVKSTIENGSVTVSKTNSSPEFDARANSVAREFFLGGSPDANKALRKYGITKEQIEANDPLAQKVINDFTKKLKDSKVKDTQRREDELQKWQIEAFKTDKAERNSGGEFMRQLNAAAITNNPNALVLGIAANVIDMGDNTRVNNVTATGDGKTIKVDYETYDKNSGTFTKAAPATLDLTNPSVRAAIQMRYASKVNEKKGTDINSVEKNTNLQGALDNRGIKKSSNDKKQTPISNKTGGMY